MVFGKTKLKDIAEIVSGYAFKSSSFQDSGIPVIKITNIKNGYVDLYDTATEYISYEDFKSLDQKYIVSKKDILISLTGSHLTQPNSVVGRVAQYNHNIDSVLNQRTGKLQIKNNKKYSKHYLYYVLSTYALRKEIALLAHGAANQANVSPKDIEKINLLLPNTQTQKKIAAILTAYDDLIENNNKRIAILEKMAEEIYKEWFVRLRFPGYQAAKVEKGIPEGWTLGRVKDLGQVVTGKTPPTDQKRFYDGEYPFIKTPNMHNNVFVFETDETLSQDGIEYQKSQTIPENSICVSCIGTSGVVAITSRTSQTNQQINSIVLENKKYLEWTYYTTCSLEETIKLFGYTGSTMTNLSKGKFENLKIIFPTQEVVEEYNKFSEPIFNVIKILLKNNLNLKITRDMLLSRLLSGKLSVENLDIKFPKSMEEDHA